MKTVLLLIILFSLQACDNPMRTRFQGTPGDINTNNKPINQAFDEEQVGDENTEENNNEPTQDPGFEDCSLGMSFYGGPNIGYFGLCQSTINESMFKLKMAESDPSIGTCFVPIHIQGQNSFKLGIAECVHNVADQTYDMTLTKERGEPINGVMVIKYGAPLFNINVNGYMQCMNAKVDYIQNTGGTSFNQQCLIQANSHPNPYDRPDIYANCVCTQFVGAFSTYYKQVSF